MIPLGRVEALLERLPLEELLAAAGLLSVVTFVGALLLLPRVVVGLPEDHFLRSRLERRAARRSWAPSHVVWAIARNVLGALLLLAGLVMLFTPGQGLLTLFVGLLVMDYPGKFRLERALVRRASVLRLLNRMRRRAGRPPLLAPDGDEPGP